MDSRANGATSGRWMARGCTASSIRTACCRTSGTCSSTFRFRRPRSRTCPMSTCWKAGCSARCWPTRPSSWVRRPSSWTTCWRCPVHRSLPGIVVQALATESVSQGAPRTSSTWMWIALLALWTALASVMYGAKWHRNLAVLVLALASIAGIALFAFAYDRLIARFRRAHACRRAAVRRRHRALARGADLACACRMRSACAVATRC